MKYITFLMLLVPFTTFGYDWCRLGGFPEDNDLVHTYSKGYYECWDNYLDKEVTFDIHSMGSLNYVTGQRMDNRIRSEDILFGVVEYYGSSEDTWYTCTVPMDGYIDRDGNWIDYKNVLPR